MWCFVIYKSNESNEKRKTMKNKEQRQKNKDKLTKNEK